MKTAIIAIQSLMSLHYFYLPECFMKKTKLVKLHKNATLNATQMESQKLSSNFFHKYGHKSISILVSFSSENILINIIKMKNVYY